MDIPLVSSLPLASVGSVAQAQARVTEDAAIVAAPPPALTTVDLSLLGRFLSATSLFQKKLLELQASASTVPEGQASTFSDIAAATTTLAVAFNELLASGIDGTDANAGTLDQQSLASLFAQQFSAQTAAAGGDEDTALASLGTIGLVLNPNPALAPGTPLTVDQPLLQVALEVDPATTTALLSRAGSAFAALVDTGVEPANLAAGAQPASAPQGTAETARDDVFRQGVPVASSALSAPTPDDAAALPAVSVVPAPTTSQAVPAASLLVAAQSPAAAQTQSATVASNAQALNQPVAAPLTRATAEKDLADRALELAEHKRTQSSSEEERAALFDAIEEQDRLKADERNVLDRAGEQQRLQQANDAQAPALAPATGIVNAVPRNVPQEEDSAAVQARPPVLLYNNAQQVARDPAIAAAIAAYNLNTGPFAALNARQELAAPKLKAVPPVSTVVKAAPSDIV